MLDEWFAVNGKRTPDSFHRELGHIMWSGCGMARTKASLEDALEKIPRLREEFWSDVRVVGGKSEMNNALEQAGRVADFLEFAETMVLDALTRDESCGGHFREEHQTEDGEAVRNDTDFCHASVWEYKGEGNRPDEHREQLDFPNVPLATRSYK